MADTGRTVFADGLWSDGFWATGLWATDEAVIVPDVVGQTQAAGTTAITDLGLTVSVSTAYSSTVAVGLIISQAPTGGSSVAPGSAVAIVVSLGDAPVTDTQASGGWWPAYDHYASQRRKRHQQQKEREEETERIQEELARDIARLLREQEAKDAEKADLQRLQKLADQYSGQKLGLPRQVSAALINAQEARTRNALQQLQREVEQMMEQEELAIVSAVLLLLD